MEIKLININLIVRDPKQPRTIFDEKQLDGMAQSILTEGVINPVEIDKDFMIVTGEMRWRAAKKAGLQEIPCKIIDITPDNRFRRQFIENVHHQTMTVLDTAKALAKMLNFAPGAKSQGQDLGISKLGREICMSESWIRDMLALLKEDQNVQEYLSIPDAKFSYIREINRQAPEELKRPLKVKVTSGEIKDRETINEIIRAVKRTPDKKEEIFSLDLSGKMPENLHKIQTISPPTEPKIQEGLTEEEQADKLANEFDSLLTKARELMSKVNLDILSLITLQMLIINNTEFLEPFHIFNQKIQALINKKELVRKSQELISETNSS